MSAERIFAAHPAPEDGGPDFRDMSENSTPSEIIERPANVVYLSDVKSADEARAKRPANFGIRASEDGETEIVEIFDEIGGWGIWASELIPHLRRIDGAGKKVEIRLNSPGGDVFEGIAISNAIRFMKADTRSVVYGLAASAASVIAVSTDELAMPANSMLMIHKPWMLTWGEAADLRDSAILLDKIEVQLIDTYAAKAKEANRDDLAQMVADETWLTAEEAVAVGLADIILDEVKMAASAVRKVRARGEVPAEAEALLAGPAAEESADEEVPAVEAAAEVVTDAAEPETPVASAEQEEAPAEITAEAEAAPETIEPEAAAEPAGLSIEAQSEIRTACKIFDASDRADEFISARATLDQVRAALWDARAEKSAQTEINPRVAPAAEDPKPTVSNGWTPGTPTTLQRANAARAGRKL